MLKFALNYVKYVKNQDLKSVLGLISEILPETLRITTFIIAQQRFQAYLQTYLAYYVLKNQNS